jgi:simple sugar transport system permease protein
VSPTAFLFATLVRATPLLLVGLAVAIAFRARVLNIGAEGQLLAGASAAVAVGLACATWPGVLLVTAELAAGVAAGALWAGIAAVLRERFGVLEVISTLMLNFVAQYGVSYLVRGPLQEPSRVYPQSISLPAAARLPALVSGQQVHVGLLFAIGLALALSWALRSTAIGFRVRAVGASATAAASAGRVRVGRVVFGVFLLSGALAGLSGAIEATGNTFALYEGMSPGFGYTAIAIALLARLDPLAVIASSLFFGALEVGAAALKRDAGVPSELAGVIEALIVLSLLAVQRSREVALTRRAAADPGSALGAG